MPGLNLLLWWVWSLTGGESKCTRNMTICDGLVLHQLLTLVGADFV